MERQSQVLVAPRPDRLSFAGNQAEVKPGFDLTQPELPPELSFCNLPKRVYLRFLRVTSCGSISLKLETIREGIRVRLESNAYVEATSGTGKVLTFSPWVHVSGGGSTKGGGCSP